MAKGKLLVAEDQYDNKPWGFKGVDPDNKPYW